MGRPLGPSGDVATQRLVVRTALGLLESATSGGAVVELEEPYRPRRPPAHDESGAADQGQGQFAVVWSFRIVRDWLAGPVCMFDLSVVVRAFGVGGGECQVEHAFLVSVLVGEVASH